MLTSCQGDNESLLDNGMPVEVSNASNQITHCRLCKLNGFVIVAYKRIAQLRISKIFIEKWIFYVYWWTVKKLAVTLKIPFSFSPNDFSNFWSNNLLQSVKAFVYASSDFIEEALDESIKMTNSLWCVNLSKHGHEIYDQSQFLHICRVSSLTKNTY